MVLNPLDDRVLIRPTEESSVSPGGIHIPDSAKKRPQRGEVMAVGPGRILDSGERSQMSVKPGNVVLFVWHSGALIEEAGIEYRVMKESDILAIVE